MTQTFELCIKVDICETYNHLSITEQS